jgi:hypothetical protein
MNSQELRALQEAYSQVYELDEVKVELKQRNKNEMQRKAGNLGREVVSSKKGPKRTAAMNRMGKLVSSIARDDEEKRFKTLGQSPAHNEEVDLYDIILSHLLDEGYADTEQAAEAIMVNMSEDWRESIVEGAAGAFVPSKVDDSNNRRDMLKNRYGQDVSPRIPGPSGGGQFEKPSSNPAGALRLAKTSSKGDTKTA